jgi:phosphoglucosamine mutase
VLDASNGATYRVAPAAFTELGADVEIIHNTPNGTNINDGCGSQHTEDLKKRVVESGAAIGLAFDGDGDRLIAVDEKGNEIRGDQVLLICADRLKKEGKLKNNLLVCTVMSNLGLRTACKKYGLNYHTAKVGDRYVLEDMLRLGSVVGGEDAGHMIFLDHHTTGDGIIAAMQLIAAMAKEGKPLSEMARMMDIFPQKLINIDVQRKPDISTVPRIMEAIGQAERELGEEGRVLVRYSGTQNMCRVMVEGPTDAVTDKYCQQIADIVTSEIG